MVEAQRALLDELMGTARNLTAEEKKGHRELRWDDKEVCGCYLVRFCPHELFINTKSDLGIPPGHVPEFTIQSSRKGDYPAIVKATFLPPDVQPGKGDLSTSEVFMVREDTECIRIFNPLVEPMKDHLHSGDKLTQTTGVQHVRCFLVLQESYEQSTRHDLYVPRFEAELAQFCEKLVQDLDRKVRRGRERLAQDVDLANVVPISTEKSDQLAAIEEKIKRLLEQSENLGEEGKVDEAQALMKKVDALNVEKSLVMQQASSERGLILSQEKKMALCEICGSFLVANDATERTQSHMTGKQHVGFGLVRDYVIEYKARKDKAREEERVAREKDQEDKRKHWENELELDKTAKENGREKEKERDEKEKKEKEKERDAPRERHREKEKADRYCDRGRGRDRERDREWDRDLEREKDWEKGRGRERDRRRTRSRSPPLPIESRSPIRHHSRRWSRSPDHRV